MSFTQSEILKTGFNAMVPTYLFQGRRTDEDDTGFIIHRLAKFLESCLEDWLKYINEKRNKYLHLNYFTIDQLVQLQRELVKVGTEVEPSVMVYPLLSAVKKDCTPADLREAMKHAQQELNMVNNIKRLFLIISEGTKSTSFHGMEQSGLSTLGL